MSMEQKRSDRCRRILLVVPDRVVGEKLAELFELAGYDAEHVRDAREALASLRCARVDALITWQELDLGSGLGLIDAGRREGLLGSTACGVVVGDAVAVALPAVAVFREPLQPQRVLRRVDELLDVVELRAEPEAVRPVELTLYISPDSDYSSRALRNLRRFLAYRRDLRVALTVADISRDRAQAESDHIAFTPTLLRRGPGSRARLIGSLDDPQALAQLVGTWEREPLRFS